MEHGGEVNAIRTMTHGVVAKEHFHMFVNNYNFLDLETKYAGAGGVDGATSLYLWRELT